MAKPVAGFNVNPQNINRKGQPKKGYSITEWFRAMLDANPEVKNAIGLAILDKALKGDPAAMKLVWGYMDGAQQQNIDLTTKGKELPAPIYGGSAVKTI